MQKLQKLCMIRIKPFFIDPEDIERVPKDKDIENLINPYFYLLIQLYYIK